MNILHIGCGFSPWRSGGSIEYCEDLMNEQTANGFRVSHFFAGRHFPFLKKNFIHKWKRKNITIYELINSTTLMGFERGTMLPRMDFDNNQINEIFKNILSEAKPDLIHIHELLGISSEIIDTAFKQNIPMVMTLHDYQPLCPTINLFDSEEKLCLDKIIGEKCLKCCLQNPLFDSNHLIKRTISEYYIKTYLPLIYKNSIDIYRTLKKKNIRTANNADFNKAHLNDIIKNYLEQKYDEIFQKRRDINLERLKKIKFLIAPSSRVKEIYENFAHFNDKIKVLPITVKHIENIKKKSIYEIKEPLKFGVLNGAASIKKGVHLLLNLLKLSEEKCIINKFQIIIYGNIDENFKTDLLNFKNVTYRGQYKLSELNNILEEIDIGIIPSMCEETYGLIGQEFLAKAIPVAANKIGGIPDYIIEGKTGWLNENCTCEGLFNKINALINNSDEINKVKQNLISNHNYISMNKHFEEIKAIYNMANSQPK